MAAVNGVIATNAASVRAGSWAGAADWNRFVHNCAANDAASNGSAERTGRDSTGWQKEERCEREKLRRSHLTKTRLHSRLVIPPVGPQALWPRCWHQNYTERLLRGNAQ